MFLPLNYKPKAGKQDLYFNGGKKLLYGLRIT